MSQPQKLDLQIRGLYTSPNNLSGVPQGALEVADNLVINSKNVAESRRGQTQYGGGVGASPLRISKIFNYASSLITNFEDTLGAHKLSYDTGDGVWVEYSGNYSDPDPDYKMRSLEALKNFYFTTSRGVYKIDSLTSTPRKAGVVKALGGTASLTGGSGFLVDDSAVAYRLVWGYRDVNNNLLLGSPSQRLIVMNSSGGDKDVSLNFTIPASITTEYFYQIYRSPGTLSAADEPSDELQLVLEGNPTAADITAKNFTVVDSTPYSLMRTTLYTSPSLEGIKNANDEPPFARDMDIFKGSAFYANITQKQRLFLALISVDSPSLGYLVDATVDTHTNFILDGIASTADLRVGMKAVGADIPSAATIVSIDSATQVTLSHATASTGTVSVEFQDRFTIGGVNYWAGSTQNAATDTFLVDVSGTPAQNINNTAINLAEIINTSASNTTLYAYYISAPEELPGQMLFEERAIGGAFFYATSTAGSSFSPALPATASPISSITGFLSSAVITTPSPHGLVTGDVVHIFGTNSVPPIDGEYSITVGSSTLFSVGFPETITVDGTSGSYFLDSDYIVSDNDARQNRVAISKPGQVEAVPLYTYFDIGSANFPIQRVVALRDGIFFFKTDGIYRLSGETFSNFTVALVDNTVSLKVPESAVPFNNQVFCFTTQGICAVTDSGVQIISVPIEDRLLELSSDQYTYFTQSSFGVAYESARLYMFFTVSHVADEVATQAFVYNSLTDSWSRWVMSRTCGVVNIAVNKLFMAKPATARILIERKSFTPADFADEQFTAFITTVVSETEIIMEDSVFNLTVGMTLVQGAREAVIEEIDDHTVTITPVSGLVPGSCICYTPIENTLKWAPIDCENPGILKQFSEISLQFKNAAFREIDAVFSTNISPSTVTVPITTFASGGWGLFSWGDEPWGGQLGGQVVLRTYVPREKQRGHWLNLELRTNQAFTGFSLQGLSTLFNPMSSRFK